MRGILNILVRLSINILNLFFEIKYKIKSILFKINETNDVQILNIYFIEIETKKIIELNCKKLLNLLNNQIKYSTILYLNLSDYMYLLKKEYSYLLEVDFVKNNKNYLINYPIEDTALFFPIYTMNELKNKNMNKITEIDCKNSNELVSILNKYSGPKGDFYVSKGLGIQLKNIYSKKLENFPFSQNNHKFDDIFFNSYEIGPECEIKPSDVLVVKSTLDDTKIHDGKVSEDFILTNYKNFKIDKKMIFEGIFNLLWRKN